MDTLPRYLTPRPHPQFGPMSPALRAENLALTSHERTPVSLSEDERWAIIHMFGYAMEHELRDIGREGPVTKTCLHLIKALHFNVSGVRYGE